MMHCDTYLYSHQPCLSTIIDYEHAQGFRYPQSHALVRRVRLEVARNHEHPRDRALDVRRPAAAKYTEALLVQTAPTPVGAVRASVRALTVNHLQRFVAEVASVALVQSHGVRRH